MAVFTCPICSIVIMENADASKDPPCPACGKRMIPKAGPGAIDISFPQKTVKETVLDLEVPEAIRQLEEKRKREQQRKNKP